MLKLFDNNISDSDEDLKLGTNKEYAKSYNKFRQKELLKKYKDRNPDESDDSDSSSDSNSSDENEITNPKFDEEFFKTLASLKSKNPVIYDKNTTFFDNVELKKDLTAVSKDKKPLTLQDYERNILLEKEGKFDDDESSDENDYKRPVSPSYVQEQEKLKKEFQNILKEDESDNDDFGGIFQKRIKTKEEKAKEEEEFTQWLAGEKEEIDDQHKKTLAPLKDYWSKTNLPQQEKFLRDYVLNKGYANRNIDEIPTYEEIVGDHLSEDEMELEKQAEFESKFNFRFEEPDKDFIKRYPRTIQNSVRVQNEKRKIKRQEVKDRKLIEKEQKMQELGILKEIKRKEIEDKISKLKEVTGNDDLPFETNELDDDFDPETHDRRMREIFNDDFYEVDEGEDKPPCPDIEDLQVEDWDNYDPKSDNFNDNGNNIHCEDDDFNMDCDYDPNAKETMQKELIDSTFDNRKKRKRRNRFMEIIKQEKPIFDDNDEKTYAEYIDEYYKMDCEDMIGDIPCRFKYVETVPNDFGLTIEEILLAKNKELNQWASLKKATQIRPENVEKKEQRLYKMKAQNDDLKRKIFKSLYGPTSSDEENDCNESIAIEPTSQPVNKKKKKKKLKRKTSDLSTSIISDEKADNKKIKKTDIDDNSLPENSKKENETDQPTVSSTLIKTEDTKRKRKKKNKKKKPVEGASVANSKQINTKNQTRVKRSDTKNPFNNNKSNQKHNNKHDGLNDERLKAYGINPRKFHKKLKYGKNNDKSLNKTN